MATFLPRFLRDPASRRSCSSFFLPIRVPFFRDRRRPAVSDYSRVTHLPCRVAACPGKWSLQYPAGSRPIRLRNAAAVGRWAYWRRTVTRAAACAAGCAGVRPRPLPGRGRSAPRRWVVLGLFRRVGVGGHPAVGVRRVSRWAEREIGGTSPWSRLADYTRHRLGLFATAAAVVIAVTITAGTALAAVGPDPGEQGWRDENGRRRLVREPVAAPGTVRVARHPRRRHARSPGHRLQRGQQPPATRRGLLRGRRDT